MTSPDAVSIAAKPPFLVAFWHHPVTRIVVYTALVITLLLGLGRSFESASARLAAHRNAAAILGNAIEPAAVLAALAVMLYAAERRRMRDAGFTARGMVTETISGYMIGLAMLSVVIGLMAVCRIYHPLGVNPGFRPWLPLYALLMVGIAEETFFRGYIFRVVEYRWGSLVALIVSSLIFGFLHILNEVHAQIPLYQKVIGPAFICLEAGPLLGAAYMATRRLWLPIGIHWAWNYFEGPVYGTDVSGTGDDPNVLIHSTLHGPFLLSGGSFGPEGSVICAIVGLVFGFLLLRVAVRAGQWKPAGEWKPQSEPRFPEVA